MKDILLETETGELACTDGDFLVGISDNQHKHLLLKLNKGALKEFPTSCVGAANYIEAEDPAGFLREIRNEYKNDGMEVQKLGFDVNGILSIDADY